MAEEEKDPTTPTWDPHRPVEPPDSEPKAVCLLDLLGFESRFRPNFDKGDVAAAIDILDSDDEHANYYARTRAFVAFSEENADWYKKLPRQQGQAPPPRGPNPPPPPLGER
jgi:hypothetical protein